MGLFNIGKKDEYGRQRRIEHRGKHLRASRTGGVTLRARTIMELRPWSSIDELQQIEGSDRGAWRPFGNWQWSAKAVREGKGGSTR